MPEKKRLEKKPVIPHEGEPVFVLRAKDDVAIEAVHAYKRALLDFVKYSQENPIIKSIDQWLEDAEQWRADNPDKCQTPTF